MCSSDLIFSHSEDCLFILFMVSFAVQKLLSLIRSANEDGYQGTGKVISPEKRGRDMSISQIGIEMCQDGGVGTKNFSPCKDGGAKG